MRSTKPKWQTFGSTRFGVLVIGRVVSPLQRWIYRLTRGTVSLTGRAPVLLLTTTGRRTGKPRTVPLFYLGDGERFVVCNVNPGFERPNPWTLNLRAQPRAQIEVKGGVVQAMAREATPDDVARYWPGLVEIWPAYERFFEQGGARSIFVLEPSRANSTRPIAAGTRPIARPMGGTMTVTREHRLEESTKNRRLAVLLAHAFAGWALCDLSMVVGMAVASVETALVVHAIGAPIFFSLVSWHYFRRFGYTNPQRTAITFVSFVIVVDFFLVALVIERSFEMFASPLGTWIPFALIFGSTYLTGRVVESRHGRASTRVGD